MWDEVVEYDDVAERWTYAVTFHDTAVYFWRETSIFGTEQTALNTGRYKFAVWLGVAISNAQNANEAARY